MSMNIAKLQAQLEHVPDQALIEYVQNPKGEVPSYLALAELSRRKEIRKQATPKQAAPTQTVAQQEIAQAQPGLAALPVRDDMYQEQSYANGGIVAFDGGGLTSADYAYGNAMDQSFLGWMPRAGMAAYSDLFGLPGQLAWMRDPKTGKLVRRYEVEGWMPQVSGFEASEAARRAGGEKKLAQAVAAEKAQLPINKAADRAVIADAMNMPAVSDAYMPGQGQRQFPTAREVPVANVPPVSPVAANRTRTPVAVDNVPAGKLPDFTAPVIPFDQASYDATMLPERKAELEAERFKSMMGEDQGLAALKDRLGKMETKAAAEEERAPWMALARAGLGMAAGKSKFAVQNIAEGATEGLKDYAATRDKLAAAEEKRFAIQAQISQTERAEKLAAVKFGTESEQYADTQNRLAKLHAADAKNTAKIHDASNALTAQHNAIQAQSDLWAHQDRVAANRVAANSAAKLSDYETYLQHAQQLPENWKVVKGRDGKEQKVFDIDRAQSNYWNARGLSDVKNQGQRLAALQAQLKNTYDPKQQALISQQIQAIISGGDPDAVSAVPGISAPRASAFKPLN